MSREGILRTLRFHHLFYDVDYYINILFGNNLITNISNTNFRLFQGFCLSYSHVDVGLEAWLFTAYFKNSSVEKKSENGLALRQFSDVISTRVFKREKLKLGPET